VFSVQRSEFRKEGTRGQPVSRKDAKTQRMSNSKKAHRSKLKAQRSKGEAFRVQRSGFREEEDSRSVSRRERRERRDLIRQD
jgi:hypothetical protein